MVTPEKLVEILKVLSIDQSIEIILKSLKNPKPKLICKKLKDTSEWYLSLSKNNQLNIHFVIKEALELGLYAIFSVLDHMHFIEDTPDKGKLELYFKKDGHVVLLNDPNTQPLTDLFKNLMQEELDI